jgi:hypothetical protein
VTGKKQVHTDLILFLRIPIHLPYQVSQFPFLEEQVYQIDLQSVVAMTIQLKVRLATEPLLDPPIVATVPVSKVA